MKIICFSDRCSPLRNESDYKYSYIDDIQNIKYVCDENDVETMKNHIIWDRRCLFYFNTRLLEMLACITLEDLQRKAFLLSKDLSCDYLYKDRYILETLKGEYCNSPKTLKEALLFLEEAGKDFYIQNKIELINKKDIENKIKELSYE